MNAQRLLSFLDTLATRANATPQAGVTRFSWSKEDKVARRILNDVFQSIGIMPFTDGVGNVHARMQGSTDAPAVYIGSHLDTVRHGGRYDGTYGVAAALEVLQSFHEEGFIPQRSIEFIAFAEEEGSNFGSTCLGSKCITGQLDAAGLQNLRNGHGTAWDALQAFGLHPERLPEEQIDPARAHAFIELHIEQNAQLETTGHRLGLVTAITGMRLLRLTLTGHSDHAASPMQGRRDPMAGFAELANRLEKELLDGTLPTGIAGTVGNIECLPNVGICIPASVTFTVDLRHVDEALLDQSLAHVEALATTLARKRGLDLELTRLSASGGTSMSALVQNAVRQAATAQDIDWLELASGPAHDAACMGRIVPTGMVFVPSCGGLSHCPQEHTTPEDLALGALVFEHTVRLLAKV